MKKLLVVSFLLVFFSVGTVFAQGKIAIVNLEEAMNRSEPGIKANAELKVYVEKVQNKAKKIASEIESINKDIEAQRTVLSQDAIQRKLADVQKKKVELERLEKDTQEDIQRKQIQYVGSIMNDMRKTIESYAKDNKIDLILELKESGTVYLNPKLDITDAIVKKFNSEYKPGK